MSENRNIRIVFIDNYDSFTYNLVEYVSEQPGTETIVRTNDVELASIRSLQPDGIIISPGPGHPENERDVGVSVPVIRELSPTIPTLGVCLGLEAAVYAHGGEVDRAPAPIHGKASPIDHDNRGVFAGIEPAFLGGRYHSLIARRIPPCFEVSATTDHDGETLIMGVRHREHPIECVQFHPESVLTAVGHDLIANFLEIVVSTDRRPVSPSND